MRITRSRFFLMRAIKDASRQENLGYCRLKFDIENFKIFAVKFAFGERSIPISYVQWAKDFAQRSGNKAYAVMSLGCRQCVNVANQRARKMLQIERLYRTKYNESYCRSMIDRLRNSLARNRKQLPVLVSLTAPVFNLENNVDTLDRISAEMNLIPNTQDAPVEKLDKSLQKTRWEKSINLPKLIGWRRKTEDNSGLYEYKLYCRFDDVSARSFYESQVDLDYRRKWDDRVVELDIIDKDEENDAEVLRWVSRFPWPMTCREYIFARQAKVDYEANQIVLIQHSVEHPQYPPVNNNKCVRVAHYTSDWVIRPHTGFDQNGVDFILTYFDNPKGSYPSACVKWVASKGVPEYVKSMHVAAVKYQEAKQSRTIPNKDSKKIEPPQPQIVRS